MTLLKWLQITPAPTGYYQALFYDTGEGESDQQAARQPGAYIYCVPVSMLALCEVEDGGEPFRAVLPMFIGEEGGEFVVGCDIPGYAGVCPTGRNVWDYVMFLTREEQATLNKDVQLLAGSTATAPRGDNFRQ